jgi:hypothetical protein
VKYYIVNFDRGALGRYSEFHKAFVAHREIKRWSHFIKSSYLIGTTLTAKELSVHFRACAKNAGISTRHLVLGISLRNRSGWMPSEAWVWFSKQIDEGAE